MTSVEFSNTLDSIKMDSNFVSEATEMTDTVRYNISMNGSNLQNDEIIVKCTAQENSVQDTHVEVSECANNNIQSNFSGVDINEQLNNGMIMDSGEVIKTSESEEPNSCDIFSSTLNDDDFPVNGIRRNSEEIVETSEIIAPYNKDNLTVDATVNDIAAASKTKTLTHKFIGLDSDENNCSLMNTSTEAIVTDSVDIGETYQSTKFCNDKDDFPIANAPVYETASNSEEMAKASQCASLDNNESDFSAIDPPLEKIASDSEEVAEISESTNKKTEENTSITDVSPNEISADSDKIPGTFEFLEANASEEPLETNERDAKSKSGKSSNYPLHRRRDMTESSLPYYRQPKPDFFEYTKRLSEKLNPSSPALSNSCIASQCTPSCSTKSVVLEEFHSPANQVSPLLEESQSKVVSKRIIFSPLKKSFRSNNLFTGEETAPDLIVLDDYEPSSHIEKSNPSIDSRPRGLKIPSVLSAAKEKSEPTPGAKYLALKEQLMEKIMLKKEASLSRRKEQEELDEENFDAEENFLECEAVESDAGSSDDDSDDDIPENTVDFSKHQDLINISSQGSADRKVDERIETSERQEFNAGRAIGRDSQESIRCFSLPSFQPGGGFSNSFSHEGTSASIFNDTADDTNDTLPDLNELGQQENVSILNHKGSKVELLPSQESDEKQIIPLWESLPIVEKQDSQLFDDDISAICSGKFIASNDEIPWTPSSSTNKKDQPANDGMPLSPFNTSSKRELDQAEDSSDDELVRPSKKVRLSKHEKLWDSDDENEEKVATEENMQLGDDFECKNKDNAYEKEGEESDVDLDEEKQSNIDSAEENDSVDVSEILMRKNASLKTSDLYDEETHDLAKEPSKKLEIKTFFENEAELSGEECSSDENEDDLDEYVVDDLITNETVTNDEKLRKEIGAIHFKRQQDEDDQVIRQLKNDFLPEGELYSENGSRKRKYVWNNMVDDNEYIETKSDSEEEEIENIQPDYLKWQQEKNKADLPNVDNEEIEISKSIGLKVDILGKVSVTRCNTITSTKISLSPMQRRGSFLNSSIGMNSKFIKEFSNSPGAVTRKNFVFSALKQDNTLPSSPITEVKNTKPTINNSIFNKI